MIRAWSFIVLLLLHGTRCSQHVFQSTDVEPRVSFIVSANKVPANVSADASLEIPTEAGPPIDLFNFLYYCQGRAELKTALAMCKSQPKLFPRLVSRTCELFGDHPVMLRARLAQVLSVHRSQFPRLSVVLCLRDRLQGGFSNITRRRLMLRLSSWLSDSIIYVIRSNSPDRTTLSFRLLYVLMRALNYGFSHAEERMIEPSFANASWSSQMMTLFAFLSRFCYSEDESGDALDFSELDCSISDLNRLLGAYQDAIKEQQAQLEQLGQDGEDLMHVLEVLTRIRKGLDGEQLKVSRAKAAKIVSK